MYMVAIGNDLLNETSKVISGKPFEPSTKSAPVDTDEGSTTGKLPWKNILLSNADKDELKKQILALR